MPEVERRLPTSSPEEAPASAPAPAGAKEDVDRPLLKGYTPMNDILNDKVKPGQFVNVMGLVRDCRLPIPSRGSDYKMEIKLYDKSLENLNSTLSVHLFCAEAHMPTVGPGDVVVIRGSKVQRYNDTPSLLSGLSTTMFFYSAARIPEATVSAPVPAPAFAASVPWARNKPGSGRPTAQEDAFVSWLYHHIDKAAIPDPIRFEEKVAQTLKVHSKTCALQNVRQESYHNVVVLVVAKPYDAGSYVTLWVTDFTEHPLFREYVDPAAEGTGGAGADPQQQQQHQVGDPHKYLTRFGGVGCGGGGGGDKKAPAVWSGPFGRRSMQVTCFEPHAAYIRSHVNAGDWVELQNLRVRLGRNGHNLEGYMREDPARGNPIRVECLTIPGRDQENVDPFLKEAIRRKYMYEKKAKAASKKRKAAEDGLCAEKGETAKLRRKRNRGQKFGEPQQQQQHQQQEKDDGKQQRDGETVEEPQLPVALVASNLNHAIVSESPDQHVTPLWEALQPINIEPKQDGTTTTTTARAKTTATTTQSITLPFVNVKFRAQVRVVDYLPARLEDFAVGRKTSEYDILSDADDAAAGGDGDESSSCLSSSSSEDEDGDARRASGTLNQHVGERVWEWRFALLLEDATPRAALPNDSNDDSGGSGSGSDSGASAPAPARIWAVVDNAEAQMLTGLTACELRRDRDTLRELREKMASLWGTLEQAKTQAVLAEQKARRAAQAAAAEAAAAERFKVQERLREQKQREERERQRQLAAQHGRSLQDYPPPPPDSSDNEEDEQQLLQQQLQQQQKQQQQQPTTDPSNAAVKPVVSNLPFVCCLRQYGVRVRMPTPNGAGRAGGTSTSSSNGQQRKTKRAWQQMFALFGTKIVYS
ncbi:telomere-binding alpha subunit central domain containing protein [Niveomyces insectorum RCEF 264]|uniref:Protection of telomeres protein 1 n=1 Tax=Niveomyces insectorum RCEF 264 TaxID=1081102 RepID=A0A162MNS2_9HYPO|nr:telomere-binding alpha subunit central domain containing protein [Niveomyces insectorum RCEF 264]